MYYYDEGSNAEKKGDLPLSYMLDDDEIEEPPIPEPYALYLEMKEAKYLKWWDGEYSAQPYILIKEFDACRQGERNFEKMKSFNLRMEQLYAKQSRGKTQ